MTVHFILAGMFDVMTTITIEKYRFVVKEVWEILRFLVALPHEFPLFVCMLTHLLITQKYPHLGSGYYYVDQKN